MIGDIKYADQHCETCKEKKLYLKALQLHEDDVSVCCENERLCRKYWEELKEEKDGRKTD